MTTTQRSAPSTVPAPRRGSRLRRWAALPLALLLAFTGLAALAGPATAAPVYELEGEWEAGTPGQPGSPDPTAGRGDVVTAVWRLNVNSDLPAPTNEPVDNVTTTITLANGVFTRLPEVCLTGGAYTPPSSLSADSRTLVCNFGTVDEGTALVLQTAITVDGPTGSELTASATFNGEQADLPPIPIVNNFGMDMLWGTPNPDVGYAADGNIFFPLDWTLYQDNASDVGPNSVSYDLNIALQNGQALTLGRWSNTPGYDGPCSPKVGTGSPGHPFSRVPVAEHPQHAPFVGSCTLVQTGPTTFRLTLTDIDYSLTQVPTQDSLGNPLPTDRVAIASGQINLKMTEALTSNTSVVLTSNAPTYTSAAGATDVDDASNNTSTKVVVLPGDWSHNFDRPNGGTRWDASYEQPPGAQVMSLTTDYGASLADSPSALVGDCAVIDAAYVDYTRVELYNFAPGDPLGAPVTPAPGILQWYVGNDPTVTPGSGGYDPDAFRGCASDAGWVTTEPADLTTVKAVRVVGTAAQFNRGYIQMRTYYTIEADAPIGQDIWTWGSYVRDGTWRHLGRGVWDPITATPGLRHNGTNGARDLVRVIFALPTISKRTDRSVLKPGESATFTLTYAANAVSAPPAVDDYQIVDRLPAGLTYVPGSATPEPTVSPDGRTLTWNLDGVATNTANTLTYQAVVGSDVTPGQTLTNTATSSVRGETSAPASAQVTVSANGYTLISKTADTPFIPNLTGEGDGEGVWSVTLRSFDPLPQSFTDTIDILPFEGDARGTDFEGDYSLVAVEPVAGSQVYYTTADPATLSDDPADPMNGAPNDPVGNTVGWTPVFTPDATAVRVIGPRLDPGATQQFKVRIATDGAEGQDLFVNRAQARAGHTELRMRTSAPMTVANYYAAALKKYVQDVDGDWHDAQDVTDYPAFRYGETVRYRIVVTNVGEGTITNLEVTDDQQPQLGSFTVDELEPGEEESHEFEIVLDESTPGGGLVNTACGTADIPNDSQVPPTINCDPAGIEVANYLTVKDSDPAPGSVIYPGDKVTYSVTVTQQGDAPAVAEFSDDLSRVLDDAAYNGDVRASIGTAAYQNGRIVWSGTIPDGEVATITYSVTVRHVKRLGNRRLLNQVTSDGCERRAGQTVNCGTDHRVGRFDLMLDKRVVSGPRATVGDTVRYRLLVTNRGPDAAPAPITVTDNLPRGVELRKAYGKGWRCSVRLVTDSVTCVRNTGLGNDRRAAPIYVVAKTTKAAIGRKVVNTARVSSAGDTVPPNNRDTAGIRVTRVPPPPSTGYRLWMRGVL